MIKTRLVGLLSHAKKYIVYTILWQWAALLSQVIAVFTVADLLERVVYGAVTAAAVKRTIFTLAIVVVIRFFCERMGARSSYLACVDVKRILREKIYEKMLKLGASYSEQVSSSEVVQVSTEGVEQLETYFGKYLPQLFYSLIAPLTLFVILCRVSMKASVILLICVPLIPISIVVVQKIAKKLLNKYWSIYTGLGDSFLENLQGLTTLKIYQADQQKADEMDVESQNFRRITMKVLTMQLNSTSVMDIVAYGGAAVGMAVAVSEFLKGNLTVSGALCIVLLASEFFLPLRLLGSFFHIAMNGMAASDKIFKILDLPEPQTGERTLPDGPLDVVLEDVHFSYEEDREILKGIDLTLPAGSFVSLVGESGCGKSTLGRTVLRLLEPTDGQIIFDGQDITHVSEREMRKYRQSMQIIFQDPYSSLNPRKSVAEIIATPLKVNHICKDRASLQKRVRELMDTVGLAERLYDAYPHELDGGRRQRICIARALAINPKFIVCDEPVETGKEPVCPSCREELRYVEEPFCMKCGKQLMEEQEYCEDCRNRKHAYIQGRSVFQYASVADAMFRFKNQGRREYADFLAWEMYRRTKEWLMTVRPDALVPVPVHKKRMKKRGYNQAAVLAERLSAYTGIPVLENWMVREGDTAPLKDLGAQERQNR